MVIYGVKRMQGCQLLIKSADTVAAQCNLEIETNLMYARAVVRVNKR